MTEVDNVPVWSGRPGAYEVWFLTATDPRSGAGYWLRSVLRAPKRGPAAGEVWFTRFDRSDEASTFGIHRSFAMDEVNVERGDVFGVDIGGSTFGSGRLVGSLAGDGHDVRWDLEFTTGGPTYRLLPDAFYRGGIAPTKPYSPNVDSRLSGSIEVDGAKIELAGVAAQQGHLIGRTHAERWAWAHCADFVDEEAVVHALVAQSRRGPITTPYLTVFGVRLGDRWIRLTKWSRGRDFGLGAWRVDLESRRYRLTGRIEAPARAMIRARYEDPDGTARFCHNSEIASCRLALFERRAGGFEEVALLESRGTTHAEWAGRTPAAAVEREQVEVHG
jgi:tocopherol cyclase-like protein